MFSPFRRLTGAEESGGVLKSTPPYGLLKHLEPAVKILRPVIERLGYTIEPAAAERVVETVD